MVLGIGKKTALLSVYNKSGIVELARELIGLGFQILSSGGTAKVLMNAGIPVTDVAEITGLGPILGHRVVTLHPAVHGGLLATNDQRSELEELGFPWIDLVCVDLYPLHQEIAKTGVDRESVIDKTDIGGPTMLRSAAKGRRIVICDPADRERVIQWLKDGCPDEDDFITRLVAKTEAVVAEYSLTSAMFHGENNFRGIIGEQVRPLRYGENPHQNPAALYKDMRINPDPLAIDQFKVVAGDPGFCNLRELDRVLKTMTTFAFGWFQNFPHLPLPRVAIGAKHGNACGASVQEDRFHALEGMLAGDPSALFGGTVILNFDIGPREADFLRTWGTGHDGKKRILDMVVAPSFTEEAIEELSRKGERCKMLANLALASLNHDSLCRDPQLAQVRGGFLLQPASTYWLDLETLQNQQELHTLDGDTVIDLLLAWAVGSTSNSNTITLTAGRNLIANAVGQQDRRGSAMLAVMRAKNAGHDIRGVTAYSDSFFPFYDGVEVLKDAGVTTILSSSGSVRDKEVIKFCEENGIRLLLVPDKECRGFFGH